MNFLLDENVPISIKQLIKELGYEAKTLKEENQLGRLKDPGKVIISKGGLDFNFV